MRSETERLHRMRQDFLANVSHELRTPLTVIHGYVDTLLGLYSQDPTLTEIFGSMQEQTARMEALIEDLLLLSKIESEDEEAPLEPVKLKAMLRGLKGDMEQLGKHHQLRWELDPSLELLGEAHELRSAFSNLMVNALRYTKAGGQVIIKTGVLPEGGAYFQVKDSGIGIAKEHIPRITERFYRVDKSRSRQSGGTGLGLAIVKHVLLRNQADLIIESVVGEGSTFRCVFPAKRVAPL